MELRKAHDEIFGNPPLDEIRLISKIAGRALTLARKLDQVFDFMEIEMDITAAHHNCPLKLEELLEADDSNFAHDIFGIRRHINRETGELEDSFMPRYAA